MLSIDTLKTAMVPNLICLCVGMWWLVMGTGGYLYIVLSMSA